MQVGSTHVGSGKGGVSMQPCDVIGTAHVPGSEPECTVMEEEEGVRCDVDIGQSAQQQQPHIRTHEKSGLGPVMRSGSKHNGGGEYAASISGGLSCQISATLPGSAATVRRLYSGVDPDSFSIVSCEGQSHRVLTTGLNTHPENKSVVEV